MAPSLPAALCRPPRSQGGHSLFSHGPVYPGGFARFLCLKYSLPNLCQDLKGWFSSTPPA